MAQFLTTRNRNRVPFEREHEEKCFSCYYATHKQLNDEGKTFSISCNYCLLEGDIKNEMPHECTHYKKGKADYDIYRSCSTCHYYEVIDTFDGYCTRHRKDIKHYRPACKKDFKPIRQRVCGNCVHNKVKDKGYYCVINKKFVCANNLCPDHKLKGRK